MVVCVGANGYLSIGKRRRDRLSAPVSQGFCPCANALWPAIPARRKNNNLRLRNTAQTAMILLACKKKNPAAQIFVYANIHFSSKKYYHFNFSYYLCSVAC